MGFTFSLKMVPRSWYQNLGTRILVPGSWYQDPGTARHGTWSHDMAWHCTRPLSTARVSLRKYFIPECVGKGLDLDLRIRPAPAPAPAPAASGNPEYTDLDPLGLRSKNKVFELSG